MRSIERVEMIGQFGPMYFFPNQDPDEANERIRKLRAGELHTFTMDLQDSRKDGTDAWTNVTISVIDRDVNGEPEKILGLFLDTTERIQLENSLRRTREQMELAPEKHASIFRAFEQRMHRRRASSVGGGARAGAGAAVDHTLDYRRARDP